MTTVEDDSNLKKNNKLLTDFCKSSHTSIDSDCRLVNLPSSLLNKWET